MDRQGKHQSEPVLCLTNEICCYLYDYRNKFLMNYTLKFLSFMSCIKNNTSMITHILKMTALDLVLFILTMLVQFPSFSLAHSPTSESVHLSHRVQYAYNSF